MNKQVFALTTILVVIGVTGYFMFFRSATTYTQRSIGIYRILNDRANDCTEETRKEFLDQADKINRRFEDAFALAINTSRDNLSPIVSDMQDAARQLSELSVDLCGKLVQSHMDAAYQSVIDSMLIFMGGDDFPLDNRRDGEFNEDEYNTRQQINRHMLYYDLYKVDYVTPFLLDDSLKPRDMRTAEDILNLAAYAEPKTYKSLPCADQALILRVSMDSIFFEERHFIISRANISAHTPTVTPTADPCSFTPTPTETSVPTSTPIPTATSHLPKSTTINLPSTITVEVGGNENGLYDVVISASDINQWKGMADGWQHSFVIDKPMTINVTALVSNGFGKPQCYIYANDALIARTAEISDGLHAYCTVEVSKKN